MGSVSSMLSLSSSDVRTPGYTRCATCVATATQSTPVSAGSSSTSAASSAALQGVRGNRKLRAHRRARRSVIFWQSIGSDAPERFSTVIVVEGSW